ncbi:MAG: hypothetical protein MUC69_01365 [Gemmatimonadales bacterium]|nr:hypothetical protein [Gemmatimonadales bacterium]
MELPTEHRIPLSWLMEHGSEAIRLRTLTELAPPGFATPEQVAAAQQALTESKLAGAVVKKQKDTGIWAANLLGLAPSAVQGIKDIGTIPQYRRLLALGYPHSARVFKLADRTLFRLLSRDEDPALLYEFLKAGKAEPAVAIWVRELFREAAAAALAEAGHLEDPRLRGAAHKIANALSTFLRSPLAAKPFVRSGKHTALHPEAFPPTWYSVSMIAHMPNLQRERAGFAERLGHYLAQPAPKKEFVIVLGKKALKPQQLLLGDPIEADSKGNAKDLPLALYYISLLARMHALEWAPVATKVLARLLADCDARGVWSPKAIRSQPKPVNKITYHWYPLHPDDKSAEGRVVDVTFRLAQVAKTLGWELHYS